ncbi:MULTISPECIES: helix-turn-helix transcriptional regulator [Niveibacterium]|uniref:Helix-turn-helix transcriptional regulator n=1 Tax=Niveibacterium microcysteis TaxID=2811415 RepID=A0ABX7M9J0_9RHOO|nr:MULTISPECIES: helix-turn-helix transcriptional regulator [Niveibacterium]QSI78383.1 helix-turn-helix transcriptional regulator [Niveibacterium microcysteis]
MSNQSTNSSGEEGFAARLRELIGDTPVAAFARRVGVSEALIRKYLAGSEPGLAKANQIARAANCSLEWLATGAGYRYRQAEVVDMAALEHAVRLTVKQLGAREISVTDEAAMKLIVALYQYLRTTKSPDGGFDVAAAESFASYLGGVCGVSA